MAYNTTVSHISPMLSYVPGMLWTESAAEDVHENQYWGNSYHATNATDGEGRVLFNWFGTDLWVFGGYRQRLGPYKVILDGVHTYDFDGFRDGDIEDFDAVLFNATNLPVTSHQLEIVNEGDVLDISRLVYQSKSVKIATVAATSTGCKWGPQNLSIPVWNSTGTISKTTNHPLGNMALNFTGKGIALYGSTGLGSSPFTVLIDGINSQTYASNSQASPSNNNSQLLFVRNDLLQGDHTIVIRNNPPGVSSSTSSGTLNIEHMEVYAADESDASSASPMSVSKSHANVVAGAITGVILLLFLCAGLFVGSRIRRKRLQQLNTIRRPRPFLIRGEYTDSSSHTESLLFHRPSVDETSVLSYIQPPPDGPFSPGSPTCVQNSDDETSPRRGKFHRQRRSLWKPPPLDRGPALPPPLPSHEDWAAPPPLSPPAKAVVWSDQQLPPPYRLMDLH